MAKKNTKQAKPRLNEPTIDDSETLVLSKNKTQLSDESLDQIPWLKERYLLPGEKAKDYDLRLKALVDSIGIHNALDAILVKDIHDEMCEMHRLRILKNTFLVNGMRKYLDRKLSDSSLIDSVVSVDPEISKFVSGWLNGDESVVPDFVDFLESKGLTLTELKMSSFRMNQENIMMVDNQMVRHQKNIRESLKLIEMRRNNVLARQRIEQEIERLTANTLEDERDES